MKILSNARTENIHLSFAEEFFSFYNNIFKRTNLEDDIIIKI